MHTAWEQSVDTYAAGLQASRQIIVRLEKNMEEIISSVRSQGFLFTFSLDLLQF